MSFPSRRGEGTSRPPPAGDAARSPGLGSAERLILPSRGVRGGVALPPCVQSSHSAKSARASMSSYERMRVSGVMASSAAPAEPGRSGFGPGLERICGEGFARRDARRTGAASASVRRASFPACPRPPGGYRFYFRCDLIKLGRICWGFPRFPSVLFSVLVSVFSCPVLVGARLGRGGRRPSRAVSAYRVKRPRRAGRCQVVTLPPDL